MISCFPLPAITRGTVLVTAFVLCLITKKTGFVSGFVGNQFHSSSSSSLPSLPLSRGKVQGALHAEASGRPTSDEANTNASAKTETNMNTRRKRRVVVVGGGWAGYTAAWSLVKQHQHQRQHQDQDQDHPETLEVVLLDASRSGGGLAGGKRTASGRPLEAGIHGFWREYRNTFAVMREIEGVGIGSSLEDDVLTPYLPSALVSQSGRVAVAPVIGDTDNCENDNDNDNDNNKNDLTLLDLPRLVRDAAVSPDRFLEAVTQVLPPPLDLAIRMDPEPSKDTDGRGSGGKRSQSVVSVLDRVSALNLLPHWADFNPQDPSSWENYDSLSAEALFLEKAKITENLYKQLVSPLLHVLPMTPGWDCSAAAALSCFHVFALQSKGAFDVRWCRGSIVDKIFAPWTRQLQTMGVDFRWATKATSIARHPLDDGFCVELLEEGTTATANNNSLTNTTTTTSRIDCDAVILAVGATSIQYIAGSSPSSTFETTALNAEAYTKLRGVTCVAVRLYLVPSPVVTRGVCGGDTALPPEYAKAMASSPVVVCGENIGNDDILAETGFCIYDLQRLQDAFAVGGGNDGYDEGSSQAEWEDCAALEVDFFRADALADLSDEDLIRRTTSALAAALDVPPLREDQILEAAVFRSRNAVTHFAVGSASISPPVTLAPRLHVCGDWVDRTGHSSWSTEKAVVTGKQAAAAVLEELRYDHDSNDDDHDSNDDGHGQLGLLEVAEDAAYLKQLRSVAAILRRTAPPTRSKGNDSSVPLSPWAFTENLFRSLNVFS